MKLCKHKIRVGNWGQKRPCHNKAVQDDFCKIHHPDSARQRQERRMNRLAAQHYQAMRRDAYKFISRATIADLVEMRIMINIRQAVLDEERRLKKSPGVSPSDIS